MSTKPAGKTPISGIITVCLLIATLIIVSYFTPVHIYKGSSGIAGGLSNYLASTFFTPSITVADLMTSSAQADQGIQKIHILVVPGHSPNEGGAEYHSLKERDIVVKIADNLADFLKNDQNAAGGTSRYSVVLARDAKQWDPIFQDYFKKEWDTLPAWITQYHNQMAMLEASGKIVKASGEVDHNTAPPAGVKRLYAINKWVDENNIDIAIHIHLNDNPRPNMNTPGQYSGFAIYVPEHQYSNAGATKEVANNIFKRMSTYFPVSSFKQESSGVVEDQELIAIGSNNTVNGVSMLIEYSYIYEPMFSTGPMQDIAAKELAYQTYLGIEDFFGKTTSAGTDMNATLPYTWAKDFHLGDGPEPDIFAMQVALLQKGYYPPAGKSHNDCSLTGTLGPCTMTALSRFQKDNGVTDENFFGPKTRTVFNNLFK